MSEIKSAKDMMLASVCNPDSDLVTRKIIGRTSLQGTSKYSYCPYCVKRVERMGQDYKTLHPLWLVTYKSLYKTSKTAGQIIYEKEWQCPVCKDQKGNPLTLTADDFSRTYSKFWERKADGTFGYNPEKEQHITLDVESIRRAGFEHYGM